MRFLAALCLSLLVSCGGGGGGGATEPPSLALSAPATWEVGPVINGQNYSIGMPSHVESVLDLSTPQAEPHYVTRPTGSLAGKTLIRMAYRVEGGPIVPVTSTASPAMLTLYFQRAGDNWSGLGEYEAYRWYAAFSTHTPITTGEHVIEARLDGNWTAVMTSSRTSNPQAFQQAMENTARVGFVLGGGTGLGHGVRATSPAKIIVLAFEVI